MSEDQKQGPSFPVWVPPGEHHRPKPGTPEWEAEVRRARAEGREPFSGPRVGGPSPGPGSSPSPGGPVLPSGRPGPSSPGPSGPPGGLASPRPPESKLVKGAKVAGALLLVVVFLYGAYQGFMWFLGWTATKIPVSWEVELGRSAAEDVVSKHPVCADRELRAYLDTLAARLQEGVPKAPYKFRILVLDVDQVNAFALPGGYVFVLRKLLDEADTSEQVAGVLAHELQHVLRRHGMKRLVRSAGILLAFRILFGDAAGFAQVLSSSAASLVNLKYDRDQEREADLYGLKLLYRAGIDPRGLPTFFEKLRAQEEKLGAAKALLPLISDHPLTSERIRALNAYIRRHGLPGNIRPLPDIQHVKGRCSPRRFTDLEEALSAGR